MKATSKLSVRCLALLGVASIAIMPQTAVAQDAPASQEGTPRDVSADQEIIVTGTQIRGVAPPGATTISVSSEDIEASGATSVAQLLQTVPQLSAFGMLQAPASTDPSVAVNRPNLRNLPGFTTAGGSTTLVLMDGHRVVGMGLSSTTPDPDIIPPGAIERVEVVPDGGSAIYGSDAVAGVMNFVTLKRFDGLKIDGSYGFADDYWRWDVNTTLGRDWGSGSIFASYNYAKSDQLLGIDRDWIRTWPNQSTGLLSLECRPGYFQNAQTGAVFHSDTNAAAVPGEGCDTTDYVATYPSSERHSVLAGLTQALSESLNVEVRGYYSNRKTHIQNGPYLVTSLISPFPLPGVPSIPSAFAMAHNPFTTGGFVQNVSSRFGPNDARQYDIGLETWGITPTLTADLGSNFQLRVLGSYGESLNTAYSTEINETAYNNAIMAGLINPYDVSASSPGVLSAVTDFQGFNKTRQYLSNVRAIIDGDLFRLPGGAAKIAVGVEYSGERLRAQRGNTVPGYENTGFGGATVAGVVIPAVAPVPRFNLTRNVKAVFGELVVPIFAADNATPGLQSLTVSAAGRYDDYSDFGGTFNPKFGLTYKPVSWLSIRGAWGTSFNAPSLADNENADVKTLYVLTGAAASFYYPSGNLLRPTGPYPAAPPGSQIVAQRGNAPGIQPQEATTWSASFDVQPPFISGLNLGATYYNIAFTNFIGLPAFESPGILYRDYSSVITLNPTQALLNAAYASSNVFNGPAPVAASTYAFFDARKRNLGDFRLDGIDFRLSYNLPTSFGSVSFNTNGTYELNRKRSATAGAPFTDIGSTNFSRFRVRTSAGLEIGGLTSQVIWNFIEGYPLDPAVGYVPQTRVSDFSTFDLFFKYDVPASGIFDDLAFTLNVGNVFDQDPPEIRGGGLNTGQTLGRLFQFGVSKKF